MGKPLSGVRVIDLSRATAGPYGTLLLADLGAEVIHIEPPEGDISRYVAGGPQYKGESFLYMSWHRNKKSVVLDLWTKSGREALYDLVKTSDIVWHNFRPGAMERLGADYDTLKEINPKIIYVSITGYGSTGPSKDRPAFDVAILAHTGVLSLTGEPGGTPVRPGPPLADMGGSIFAAIGALSAIFDRERTGKGRFIDVCLQDACISFLSDYFSLYFLSGVTPEPFEHSGHRFSVPYGVYKTKKSYIALGPCWPRIARAIGADWLPDDPRFKEDSDRDKNRAELNRILEEHLAQAEAEDWLEIFKVEDIPADLVKTIDQVAIDPQVLHRKMVLSLSHPLGGTVKLAGNPIKMEGLIEEDYTGPPTLDQHGHEILSELLGYTEEKIKKLKQEEKENTQERLKHVRKMQV
ncbi:MAG: CoA transferase [Deltaproteobacteria bacterium]|nr:MAG: CoA transferase [Deltaproteobacteria bacterium]